jgi:hypothetical protein
MVLNDPFGQSKQNVDPVVFANEPFSQLSHLIDPVLLEFILVYKKFQLYS